MILIAKHKKAFENCEKLAQTKILLGEESQTLLSVGISSFQRNVNNENYMRLTQPSNNYIVYQMAIGGDFIVQCGLINLINS